VIAATFGVELITHQKMKNISTLCILLVASLFIPDAGAQDVGIGTSAPDHKLHIADNTSTLLKLDNTTALNTGVMSDLYFKTGLHYTGAIKTIGTGTVTARLGFFTYATTVPSQLLERLSIADGGNVGIGVNNPQFLLDVNGRMRVRNGNGTAGVVFMDAANANNRGIVGMEDDNNIGFYGYNGGGWGLSMNTATGAVDIDGALNVSENLSTTAYFNNFSGTSDGVAVHAVANIDEGYGAALKAEGGATGIVAKADIFGIGSRIGLQAYGKQGAINNYGIYAEALGGAQAIGIYASGSGAPTSWGGYFSGSLYSTGNYQGSDRKLKSGIQPITNAISLVQALKPSTYAYKTSEYKQMELPEGQQFGLIADEVKEVFPALVKAAIQPAKYENDDRENGRVVMEEVSFEAVNYTALIPVLIAAMQEQQQMIEAQQRKIEALEAALK
jgi:hypothetical protein